MKREEMLKDIEKLERKQDRLSGSVNAYKGKLEVLKKEIKEEEENLEALGRSQGGVKAAITRADKKREKCEAEAEKAEKALEEIEGSIKAATLKKKKKLTEIEETAQDEVEKIHSEYKSITGKVGQATRKMKDYVVAAKKFVDDNKELLEE